MLTRLERSLVGTIIFVVSALSGVAGFYVGYNIGARDTNAQWAVQRDALNTQIDHWQSVARSRTGR